MKTIAYSCAAEGMGHVTGLLAVSHYLKEKYNIVFFCPKKVEHVIRKKFPNNDIVIVPGLYFPMRGEKVDYLHLIVYGFRIFITQNFTVRKVAKIFKEKNISACISDFEPYTVRAARKLKLPRMQLNHSGAVLLDHDKSFGARLQRFGINLIQSHPIKGLYSSFYNGHVGPLLRPEIVNAKTENGKHFVCYLPPNLKAEVEVFAKEHPDMDFRFFPNEKEDYIKAFTTARGIIARGGHQTICESLFLKKPILTFPMEHQYEQTLNCVHLVKSGRGMMGDRKNIAKSLEDFDKWIDGYPYPASDENEKFVFEDDSEKAANLVLEFLKENE